MNFLLDKRSDIVLYGAGSMAVSWAEKAACIGFTVKLFIDKSANEIEKIKSTPVVTFEQYSDIASVDDIVIIMLQNAVWHKKIVEQLQGIGISKVIYFPMHVCRMNRNRVFCLRRKYNKCIQFKFDDFLQIPILSDDAYDENEGIVWEDEKEIIIWAPVELCYSIQGDAEEKIWKSDYTKEAMELISQYIYNKNLMVLRPYWELFSFLNGKANNCSMYLKIFGKDGHVNHQRYNNVEFLRDRNKLVEIFKDEFCRGNDFFEQSPADSGIGRQGKIVIYDGIHRSIFLITNGYWWIPVRLSKKDYKYLFNYEAVQKLEKYMELNNMSELEYPIESFGFYRYPVKYQYVRVIWKQLAREIANRKWNLKKVFDISLTNAYFSRMFYREGAEKIYCLLGEENNIPLHVNDIFRIDNIEYIYDVSDVYVITSKCEIIIAPIEQFIRLFSQRTFVWKEGLKCIVVYDILIEDGISILEKIFGDSRRCDLVKKYVTDGMMQGMYIIE